MICGAEELHDIFDNVCHPKRKCVVSTSIKQQNERFPFSQKMQLSQMLIVILWN
jgi:hypothetical protein